MIQALIYPEETHRIEAFKQYGLLETHSEEELDDLTAMAAQICGVPIALISLLDGQRQWFKAAIGLELSEVSRDVSFCSHAVIQRDLFIVPDATLDCRFAQNPMVLSDPSIRFYAGAPLVSPENVALGTLCVIDRVPRTLEETQKKSLRVLARQVMKHFELGRQTSALRTSEERFFCSFENAGIGMALVSLDGHWLKVNDALCDLLGYSAKDLCSKTVAELTHPDDVEANLANARRLLGGGNNFYKMEKRYFHQSGQVVWVLLSVSLIRDKKQRPLHFITQIEDISEIKQAVIQQQELTKKAQAAEKAKSQFLATMSHEIRTPLNGVIGMASILADTELNEMQRECVETINISGESLLAVINDILDYSKIEAGRLELEKRSFILQQCVEEAFDIFATQIRSKQLEAVYFVAPEIPINLTGDSTRLRQILVNLIGNAIKFTAKGEIVVHVGYQKKNEAGHHLLFSVSDTGIGIPKEAADKLFNAFQQVDTSTTRQFGGTGLGLAICKRLTGFMGGNIWVESTAGKGSTFNFNIVLQDAPVGEHDDSHYASGVLHSRTALIVDDHPTNRRILELKLKFWGMTPMSVTSGQEALELLADRKFDVILVDLLMPGMDGVTLARKIRTAHQTPLLLLSCTGELLRGDEASLFEHQISKPIKHSILFNTLLRVTGAQEQPSRKALEKKLDNSLSEKKPLRILLAEDNVINQKVGLRMLSRFGYTANVVANGKLALEALEHNTFDLILMDIQMPEMNGIDAARMVRERLGGESPVMVALTAEALEGDEERFLNLGFDGYLSKPLQPQKLQQVLEAIVPHS